MAQDKKPEKPTYVTKPKTEPRNIALGDKINPNANKKGGSNNTSNK